jgi:ATP-dependent Clp protease ATP-binding subunit ClpA
VSSRASPSSSGQDDPLEKFGVDFTARAAEGKLDPVIGRDDEIRRAIQILSRRTKNNPVLIGDPGVGEFACGHVARWNLVLTWLVESRSMSDEFMSILIV